MITVMTVTVYDRERRIPTLKRDIDNVIVVHFSFTIRVGLLSASFEK